MGPRQFTLLCQRAWGGREERLVYQVALVWGIPLRNASLDRIEDHRAELAAGACVPVGSVEFVRRAMRLAGITEPANLSYPDELRAYLHRSLEQRPAGELIGRWFVKPTATKAFTGFVFDTFADPADLHAHDRDQREAFLALDPQTPVWVSEPVAWLSEARYYVLDGQIVGEGRYDDGPDDAPLPDPAVVQEMARRFSASPEAPVAFALDAGVLECGTTALVEVNDAWALGYYSGTLRASMYVRMLWRRWRQLSASN